MKKSFLGHIYDSCVRVHGFLFALISIIGMFVFYSLASYEPKILITIFLAIITLLVFIIIVLFDATFRALKKANFPFPKVIYSKSAPDAYSSGYAIALLEPSELFNYDQMVTFYIKDGDLEIPIGNGHIVNIQTDGKIQVLLTSLINEENEYLEKMKNNDTDLHKKMLIKSSTKSANILNGMAQ